MKKLLLALALLASSAYADFTGKVVAVADGDTITVLRDHVQVKVRLVEIDAPEKAQAFGNRSKESLSAMCFGKMATLVDKGKDRYGRTLGAVYFEEVSRSTYYQSGIQNGWLTRNEARIAENLNPLTGLDEPLRPLNTA